MITVEIKKDGMPLGIIELINMGSAETDYPEFCDYEVRYWVRRGGATGNHKRTIYRFPRKTVNVFGLVRHALILLNEKDLTLERDFDPDEAPVPTDMGGGLDRAMPKVQGWLSRLHRD